MCLEGITTTRRLTHQLWILNHPGLQHQHLAPRNAQTKGHSGHNCLHHGHLRSGYFIAFHHFSSVHCHCPQECPSHQQHWMSADYRQRFRLLDLHHCCHYSRHPCHCHHQNHPHHRHTDHCHHHQHRLRHFAGIDANPSTNIMDIHTPHHQSQQYTPTYTDIDHTEIATSKNTK